MRTTLASTVTAAIVLVTTSAHAFTAASFAVPPGWIDTSPGSAALTDPNTPDAIRQMMAGGQYIASAFDLAHADDGFGENFNVVIRPFGGTTGPLDARFVDDVAGGMATQLNAMYPGSNYRVLEKGVVLAAGAHAGRLVTTGTLGASRVEQLVYILPGAGQLAIITYSSTPDQFAAYLPAFEQAARATRDVIEPARVVTAWDRIRRNAMIGAAVGALLGLVTAAFRKIRS